MLKVRKVSHRPTHYLTLDSGEEVQVQFEPLDFMDMHAERVGDKLVVAYLSADDDGSSSNPMENSDCQGNIYTKPSRYGYNSVVTDDMSELLSALQLNGENEVNPSVVFTIDGVSASLEDHAVTVFMAEHYGDDLTDEWMAEGGQELTPDDEDRSIDNRDEIESDILNGTFKYDEHQALMLELYQKHWREIVGPYVVPISYCSSNHGPGTSSAGVANWDGDPDDLPDGVWVADKDAIENIDTVALPEGVSIRWEGALSVEGSTLHAIVSKADVDVFDAGVESNSWGRALTWAREQYGEPSQADLAKVAETYAAAILEEYVSWCNGNVYGCCVETFAEVVLDNGETEFESLGSDECWGFIGSEHAEESLLNEFFKPAVEAAAV